jgi:hypothetical protein
MRLAKGRIDLYFAFRQPHFHKRNRALYRKSRQKTNTAGEIEPHSICCQPHSAIQLTDEADGAQRPSMPGRGMYFQLRQRPLSREHARSHSAPGRQPPVRRTEEEGPEAEPAPVPFGDTGHRTQRPRGQVGPPPTPRTRPAQPRPAAPPWTQGA